MKNNIILTIWVILCFVVTLCLVQKSYSYPGGFLCYSTFEAVYNATDASVDGLETSHTEFVASLAAIDAWLFLNGSDPDYETVLGLRNSIENLMAVVDGSHYLATLDMIDADEYIYDEDYCAVEDACELAMQDFAIGNAARDLINSKITTCENLTGENF